MGKYKNPVWVDGKDVKASEWVKENNVQMPRNPPAKESEIEVLRVNWVHAPEQRMKINL